MYRTRRAAKLFSITFAVVFVLTNVIMLVRFGDLDKVMSRMVLAATFSSAIALFLAWKVDEAQQAQLGARAFQNAQANGSSAVFVDKAGRVIDAPPSGDRLTSPE